MKEKRQTAVPPLHKNYVQMLTCSKPFVSKISNPKISKIHPDEGHPENAPCSLIPTISVEEDHDVAEGV